MLPNCRGCRIVEVIECVTLEGKGVEGDPYRQVVRYYDRNGNLLAVNDDSKAPDLKKKPRGKPFTKGDSRIRQFRIPPHNLAPQNEGAG